MSKNKFFRSTEEAVSMFLGLAIVLLVVGLVINFFNKRNGSISSPGVNSDMELADKEMSEPGVSGEYVVKAGDSLWTIALNELKDGYRWNEVAKLNNIKNPGLIEIGQKIKLPEFKTADVAIAKQMEYMVVAGDSLWDIAVKNYNDGYQWTKIWDANRSAISNPNKIEIGMKLMLP
jgi:nucleoid-associated protein YgaU